MAPLRQLRRQGALTQEQLGASADVSPSTVYHIEAGKVRPRPSILRAVLVQFQEIADELADGSAEKVAL